MLFFRPAQPADANAIASVHVVSWQWAYRNILPEAFLEALSIDDRCRNWRRILTSATSQVHLAWVGEELAGWAAYGASRDGDHDATWGEIHAMYLRPAWIGKGIGGALMTQVLEQMARLGHEHVALWVLEKNVAARRFYERYGFRADIASRDVEIGGTRVTEIRYCRPIAPGQNRAHVSC